jgi:nickel-dependent lactate racemase
LVKTLHRIATISDRISSASGQLLRLEHVANAATHAASARRDPAATVASALAAPLDYPPLSAGTVPGDRVAIAVDDGVPCPGAVVRGVVEALRTAGIEDDAISIVTTASEFGRVCRSELDAGKASEIQSVTHDPEDENNLCLVGVPKRREPLLVNRTIYDADVVLPIGCARLGSCGAFDSLFPSFSSAEAVDRYRTPAGHDSDASHADMVRETNEAGWLIGVPLVMTVVPGPGETVAHVVAGEPQAVDRRTAELCRDQWALVSPQRASLVIATVSGGAAAQTWTNVGRALAAAQRLVDDDGAIAICTNLDEPLGPSLSRLSGNPDLAAARRKIAHDHSDDSWPAWQLASALERGPVYFLSLLDADIVEELGMAPIADIDELVRLATRSESCIVLDDAQHAVATVAGEEDEA